MVRRLLSPATVARLERQLADSGKTLTGQPIDLAAERFTVYVPSTAPAHGYALVVFVPPWQQAGLPQGLGRGTGPTTVTIFVTAARSGNTENTMARREPLALLAAQNIMADYPVDPERVYIAGFSGGSRIALRLAIGYPDLFRGAILNAGSDATRRSKCRATHSIAAAGAVLPVPERHALDLHYRRARRRARR